MSDYTEAFDWLSSGWGVPSLHGGGDNPSGGGLVGLIETLLASVTNLLESGAAISLFPGIRALASNVHPLIVHFPIAFLSAYFLLEVAGLILRRAVIRQVASWMLYLGAIGAAAAVGAGLVAAALPHGDAVHEIMEWHERLMLSVFGLAVVLALWRALAGAAVSTMAVGLQLFLATAMMALMLFGTDLGGLMVYRYGVGVASLQTPGDVHEHVHAGPTRTDASRSADLDGSE